MEPRVELRIHAFVSRTLDLRTDDATIEPCVLIEIAQPQRAADGNWSCAYHVTGLPEIESGIVRVLGADGVQAFNNARVVLEGLLGGTDAAREGRLTWLGRSHGFLD